MTDRIHRNIVQLTLLGLAIVLGGCAGASVSQSQRAGAMPKPDMIIVNDFAVSASEVRLDQGLMAKAMRDGDPRDISAEENQVGHMVADKLSESLVEELRKAGIHAARGSTGMVHPSSTTVILHGEFVTIDQGNQTARVWVGFGMGGSELRTRVQALQAGNVVAQAETATHSSLKPGMLASLGAGAAAESGAAIAAGAVGTGVSETFLATVTADAQRTAKEIAKKITQAYKDRGWL
jgi:hypothetical protein